jgi:hypothetical protein
VHGHPSIGVEASQTAAQLDLVGVTVELAEAPTDPVEAEDGAGRTTGRGDLRETKKEKRVTASSLI